MNIDLRPSTRQMIEQSPAAAEAWGFIEWLRTERYTHYTIDCHIRRLLFVIPRLTPGSSPPILRDKALVAAFGRERRPYTRFTNFAGTRRAYTRVPERTGGALCANPRLRTRAFSVDITIILSTFGACPSQRAIITTSPCVPFS
jgi:hypothetical protein